MLGFEVVGVWRSLLELVFGCLSTEGSRADSMDAFSTIESEFGCIKQKRMATGRFLVADSVSAAGAGGIGGGGGTSTMGSGSAPKSQAFFFFFLSA